MSIGLSGSGFEAGLSAAAHAYEFAGTAAACYHTEGCSLLLYLLKYF